MTKENGEGDAAKAAAEKLAAEEAAKTKKPVWLKQKAHKTKSKSKPKGKVMLAGGAKAPVVEEKKPSGKENKEPRAPRNRDNDSDGEYSGRFFYFAFM